MDPGRLLVEGSANLPGRELVEGRPPGRSPSVEGRPTGSPPSPAGSDPGIPAGDPPGRATGSPPGSEGIPRPVADSVKVSSAEMSSPFEAAPVETDRDSYRARPRETGVGNKGRRGVNSTKKVLEALFERKENPPRSLNLWLSLELRPQSLPPPPR